MFEENYVTKAALTLSPNLASNSYIRKRCWPVEIWFITDYLLAVHY